MRTAQENDLVLLISPDGKRYTQRLREGARFESHLGVIPHDQIIGTSLGREITTHSGKLFMVLYPTLHDMLMNLRRASQIVYPKDIGQILLRLNVGSGKRIIEAGTGSGALCTALAHSVQPGGLVYSYDSRPDMLNIARRNLESVGLLEYVEFIHRDIAEGFCQTEVDALFLDVREPWEYLNHVCHALSDGGVFGALVPTTNQVSWLLSEMRAFPMTSIVVMETFERYYKPVPARLRPDDRMVGHTGFLVFARTVHRDEPEIRAEGSEEAQSGDAGDSDITATC